MSCQRLLAGVIFDSRQRLPSFPLSFYNLFGAAANFGGGGGGAGWLRGTLPFTGGVAVSVLFPFPFTYPVWRTAATPPYNPFHILKWPLVSRLQ